MPQIILPSEERKKTALWLVPTVVVAAVIVAVGLALFINNLIQQQNAAKAAKLTQQAESAANSHDYRTAYNDYVAADKLTPSNLKVKVGAAQAAMSLGYKSSAIHYYQQAIPLVPASPKQAHDEKVSEYQDQIRGLGGTP